MNLLTPEVVEVIEEMLTTTARQVPDRFAQVYLSIHLETLADGRFAVKQLSIMPVVGQTVRLPRGKKG